MGEGDRYSHKRSGVITEKLLKAEVGEGDGEEDRNVDSSRLGGDVVVIVVSGEGERGECEDKWLIGGREGGSGGGEDSILQFIPKRQNQQNSNTKKKNRRGIQHQKSPFI